MVHKAKLYSPPWAVLPMSAAMALVKLLVGDNRFEANERVLPITIDTAKASPIALARPRMIPVKIPPEAAGKTTLPITCQRVAPKP